MASSKIKERFLI